MSAATPFRALLAVFIGPVAAGCASVAPPEAESPIAVDGQAIAIQGERYLETRVGIHIDAPPEAVWAVLSDGPSWPKWNSTVTSFKGTIAEGETVALKVEIDPKRTFKLLVSTFDPGKTLVMEDGGKAFRGVRTYRLVATADGGTEFTMREVMTGTMMEMIAPKLPDFRPPFTQFAADLKATAEGS